MPKVLTSPRFIVALIAVLFCLNLLGLVFHWYDTVSWLDNVHHTLGGFWIGVLGFYLVKIRPKLFVLPDTFWGSMIGVLALAALAGVLWEIYEFVFYFMIVKVPPPLFGHADTISDLCFDLFGAMVAVLLVKLPSFRK